MTVGFPIISAFCPVSHEGLKGCILVSRDVNVKEPNKNGKAKAGSNHT